MVVVVVVSSALFAFEVSVFVLLFVVVVVAAAAAAVAEEQHAVVAPDLELALRHGLVHELLDPIAAQRRQHQRRHRPAASVCRIRAPERRLERIQRRRRRRRRRPVLGLGHRGSLGSLGSLGCVVPSHSRQRRQDHPREVHRRLRRRGGTTGSRTSAARRYERARGRRP